MAEITKERLLAAMENARSAKPPEQGFWDRPAEFGDPRVPAYRQGVREAVEIIRLDLLGETHEARAASNQLGPFNEKETSRHAALDNYPRSGSQRHRVLLSIATSSATRNELGRRLNLSTDSVRPRVWELMNGGFVEESGLTRITELKSQAAVLRVTQKGRKQIEEHRRL